MNIIDRLMLAGSGFGVATAVMAMGQGDAGGVAISLIASFGLWRLASWKPRDWRED